MSDKIEVINLGSEQEGSNKVVDKRRLIGYDILDGIKPDKRLAMKLRHINFHESSLDYMNASNEPIEIKYEDIDHIVISMCSRLNNWGVFSELYYYLDLDIHTNGDVYKLELHNTRNAPNILELIKDNNIKYEDEVGVYKLFEEHSDHLARHRYFQAHFKEIAKEFNLDNPRDPKPFRSY